MLGTSPMLAIGKALAEAEAAAGMARVKTWLLITMIIDHATKGNGENHHHHHNHHHHLIRWKSVVTWHRWLNSSALCWGVVLVTLKPDVSDGHSEDGLAIIKPVHKDQDHLQHNYHQHDYQLWCVRINRAKKPQELVVHLIIEVKEGGGQLPVLNQPDKLKNSRLKQQGLRVTMSLFSPPASAPLPPSPSSARSRSSWIPAFPGRCR